MTYLIVIDIHEGVTARLNFREYSTGRFEGVRSRAAASHDSARNVLFSELLQRQLRFLNDFINSCFAVLRGADVLIPTLVALVQDNSIPRSVRQYFIRI